MNVVGALLEIPFVNAKHWDAADVCRHLQQYQTIHLKGFGAAVQIPTNDFVMKSYADTLGN